MAITRPRRAKFTRAQDGFLAFSVEIDPAVKNIVENIRFMRMAVLDGVFDLAENTGREMEQFAKRYARWWDHPKRHPSKRYPSPGTARENLTTTVERLPSSIRITIAHAPETVKVTARGRVITYGGILESNYHGPYAILQPTMGRFATDFRTLARGAAVVGYRKRVRGS